MTTPPVDDELARRALAAGRAAGLDAAGLATVAPFAGAREALEERRAAGLHGGMAFTYRNPARSTDPRALLPSARALLAGALLHGGEPAAPAGPGPHGRVARYARQDHYDRLRHALDAAGAVLRAEGWRALVVVDQNHLVDRAVAHRAGLGWYGRNSLLLMPGVGSWSVLGAVLTDAPLVAEDPEPVADGCGPCTRCVTGCPTDAIVAPGVVDARRCLAWLVQAPGPLRRDLREAMGDRIYGCDDCQEVCPPNRVRLRRRERAADDTPLVDDDPAAWVDLLELLAADDATLLDRHGRWYVADRDPRHLRRNALVGLGNVADPDDPAVVAALVRVLGGGDDLLVAHAAWAARRLGREDLLAHVVDPGPEARAELAAAAPTPRAPAAKEHPAR
ncbi:tRNA epoxyqueuosine(34) reductase QueG [Iamia majanohamensis]|uniref:tRNA epoxyqueuosine(34) reductase QueG n=1 Tax=Iamia majanohamensis TaxID=467976 RepID=A0AAE9YCH8_9ACTN|nr:tRNA epoxyqueuosine(34) reductase QueG [Iamia majanohamensis]WCO65276.1 tRNA epoxyqueuosine(34) reductase QueG [Iamia majanohamensis]